MCRSGQSGRTEMDGVLLNQREREISSLATYQLVFPLIKHTSRSIHVVPSSQLLHITLLHFIET